MEIIKGYLQGEISLSFEYNYVKMVFNLKDMVFLDILKVLDPSQGDTDCLFRKQSFGIWTVLDETFPSEKYF